MEAPTRSNFGAVTENRNGSTSKLDALRTDVEQTAQIMKTAMIKAYERDILLQKLDERSEQLTNATQEFSKTSRRTSRMMWWRNMKSKLVIGGVIFVLIVVVGISIAALVPSGGQSDQAKTKHQMVE